LRLEVHFDRDVGLEREAEVARHFDAEVIQVDVSGAFDVDAGGGARRLVEDLHFFGLAVHLEVAHRPRRHLLALFGEAKRPARHDQLGLGELLGLEVLLAHVLVAQRDARR
jgi:hypothetical protein